MIKQVCTYFAVSYKGFTKLKLFYFSTFKIVRQKLDVEFEINVHVYSCNKILNYYTIVFIQSRTRCVS